MKVMQDTYKKEQAQKYLKKLKIYTNTIGIVIHTRFMSLGYVQNCMKNSSMFS